MNRRQLLFASAASLAVAAWPRAFAASDAGSFETVEFDWADAARQRRVPVRLYQPQASQRVPLVLFSHGIGGTRRGYSWFGQHLAASGIASLHVQHVGSDVQVWTGGNLFGVVGRLQDAAQDGEAIHRAQDLRFALDTVLTGELSGRFDTQRIAAAGHSYGANTTLLAAGARVARNGRIVDLHDERVRAAIVISAPPFYGEADFKPILHRVTVPSLHVTCTEDTIRIPGYYSGVADRLAVFEATASPRKWLAVYEGGSHSMFTDRLGAGGSTLNPQVKAATRALALAFLRGVFDGDGAALAAWPREHAAILARFSGA